MRVRNTFGAPVKNKSIVAFFGGTGYDYHNMKLGSVNPRALGDKKIIERASDASGSKQTDESFTALTDYLDDSQLRFGYDGCHNRGGVIFAFGVKEPAQHLYDSVKKQLADDASLEKVKVVLTAHSRGCLSALLFAKKIAADADLKNKVDIILDLRDPVPGNFKWAANADVAKVTTMASQLADLSHCDNITSAHITIQEQGYNYFGFSVLVPTFSPTTDLQIDCMPGIHDIQETYERKKADIEHSYKLRYDEDINANKWRGKNGCWEIYDKIYLLGIAKSLQLYIENGVEVRDEKIKGLIRRVNEVISTDKKVDPPTKDTYIDALKLCQVLIYESVRDEDFNIIPANKHLLKTRELHFGGEIQQHAFHSDSAFINTRHRELAVETKFTEDSSRDDKLLYGYVGPRSDIGLDGKYQLLIAKCHNYIKYLKTKNKDHSYDEQIAKVVELQNVLDGEPRSKRGKLDKIEKFSEKFEALKANLAAPQSYAFIKGVMHVLASIFTLGIYTAVRVAHSKQTKGTAKFWQSHKQAFSSVLTNELLTINNSHKKPKN